MELASAAYKIGALTLIRARDDPKKNFVIQAIKPLDKEAWIRSLADAQTDEALVFVHGFNVSFENALMRTAQLVWDLQYKGPAVLFSWPSRGGFRGYGYDKDSAFGSRQRFLELLALLQVDAGVKKVNVIAHSMGNLVVVDALANYARTQNPRAISELILAAPDVDQDLFTDDVAALSKIVGGITMYASSADRALEVARQMANDRRAGEIFNGQPLTLAGMDSIDATAAGKDLFGLNHSLFATTRSLITDIKALLTSKLRRPPDERSPEIRGFPEGAAARYWRVVR
jgi:esterase/lipase superfamily enzyme